MITELYPHALGAILGGSAAQGRATATSDLDVAVLLPDSDISRREVIRHQGRIVELFLNTLADIPEFFAWDRARRRGTVLFVYDQGLPLTDPHGHVAHARQLARDVLASGPPPLSTAEWAHGRYVLTCFLDDLTDTPPDSRYEQLSLAEGAAPSSRPAHRPPQRLDRYRQMASPPTAQCRPSPGQSTAGWAPGRSRARRP
ncbi:nucleotidyltransferase domain-containing protein, partial [Streptomyces sp. NPDC056486]|uniref:nucleotidyltransferase domain-containing protein n=1 Tax=Streptomyces sp. NPDC056486 TaxID=3345835 RepID=UPI0036CE89DC